MRLVWDSDVPGVLVPDDMGHPKMYTWEAAAMICKLLAEKGAVGMALLLGWGSTHEERVNKPQNDYYRIVYDEWELYTLLRLISVSCCLLEMQKTPSLGNPFHVSAVEPILVFLRAGAAETCKIVPNGIPCGNNVKLRNMIGAENLIFANDILTACIHMADKTSNIDHFPSGTIPCRVKPSCSSQLSENPWSFQILDKSG